ncbi:F-box/FBD/LRR-repeat protein At1g13570-like [Lycium barbarum]|uniref:F-box/FBD/LRR-repeat protein At1g13570-like n=1 Tax=Lycium barbarum TaxID=112863 RepID=UPI00293E1BE8|nr:F-box/FBD/LRR-repeat protein At1g13570-like [Lycium barbarum]
MTPDRKRVAAVEGDTEDRLSALPRNVIHDILRLLPVHDAARTSILSKNWRYIWAILPNLVLDKHFCNKLALKSQSVLKETVDEILLQHLGDIVKFVRDISGTHLTSYADIDRWMRFVTRNNVKELILGMPDNSTYKLPSHVFNCPTLTSLKLFNCIVKPTNSFLGFQNLTTLRLEKITFVPTMEFWVINAPLLVNLTLKHCNGTQYLDTVVSSGLKYLSVRETHFNLDLNRFMNYKNLTNLYLVVESPIATDERSTYEKLISSVPTLQVLTLGSFVLELLSTGVVTKGLPFTLNCLWHLRLGVNLGQMGQTSCALELIKSFHNLSKLDIWVCVACDNAEAVMKYLDRPTCLDRPLDKLKDVDMYLYNGSKVELLFIKLLFARTPSLVRMDIKQKEALGTREERNITKELMRFPRASPKAELFYSTNADQDFKSVDLRFDAINAH